MLLSIHLVDVLPGLMLTAIGLVSGTLVGRTLRKTIRLGRKARSSQTWPSVPGRIVKATAKPTIRNFTLEIEYTYKVDGVAYTGNRFAFDTDTLYRWYEKEKILDRYPPRTSVTVYYNADDPQESTLEQKPRGITSTLLLMALLLFFPTFISLALGLIALAEELQWIK